MDEQEVTSTTEPDEQNISQMEPAPPPTSHSKLIIGIVVAFVLVVAGSVGAYFYVFQQEVVNKNIEDKNNEKADELEEGNVETADWNIYQHNLYSINYPENFDIFAAGDKDTLVTPRSTSIGKIFIARNNLRGKDASLALISISASSPSFFKTLSEFEKRLEETATTYKRIQLNGIQALEIESDTYITTGLIMNNTSFEISVLKDVSEQELNVAKIILSTLDSTKRANVKDNSRDNQRLNDVKLYNLAMELYHSDKAVYPKSSGAGFITPIPDIIKNSLDSYLAITPPDDPNGPTYGYWWLNGTDGTNYCIYAAGSHSPAPG